MSCLPFGFVVKQWFPKRIEEKLIAVLDSTKPRRIEDKLDDKIRSQSDVS